jgi:peptidyl-prolyl cis-trans isomerase SurA
LLVYFVEAEIVDRILAIVGDEVILKSEVDQYVEHQKYSSKSNFDENLFRKKVLDELISNKIIYDMALRDSTIKVSDDEVQKILDNRINSIIDQVGSEAKFEELYNTTVNELKKQYRSDIRKSLFVDKLKRKHDQKITVSRNEVEDFFNTFKDSLPPVKSTVSLSQLVINFSGDELKKTKSIEVLKDIKGKIISKELSFEAAAELYSHDDASKKKGGNIGYTTRGDLVPEYERTAFNLQQGEISDPVKTGFGYHLIKLIEKSGEKINTSHILIKAESTLDNDSMAQKFAITIKDSILNKKMAFEEAVKKYSNDEKTKYSDGQIGILEIDELDKRYVEIFKNSDIGHITEPIKEKDGYYIYKINDKRDAHKIDLSTDFSYLKNITLERKRDNELKKWIDELRKKVYIELK